MGTPRWAVCLVAGAITGAIFLALFAPRGEEYVPATTVWEVVQDEASNAGLDPAFIYAIAFAESSFDANADSGYARGMMQMSEVAWETVRDDSYARAWNWRENISAGVAYLSHLKNRLEKDGRFSYPLLAAAYRYGYGRLKRNNFNLGALPQPRNQTYQHLLAGNLAPISVPQ